MKTRGLLSYNVGLASVHVLVCGTLPFYFCLSSPFRAILVIQPLHYKRLVTKKRLHVVYNGLLISYTLLVALAFVFFRSDALTIVNKCLVKFVVQEIPNLILGLGFFVVLGTITIVCYVCMTTVLCKRSKGPLIGTTFSQSNISAKVTKAAWLTVGAFLLVNAPFVILAFVTYFLPPPFPTFVFVMWDISFMLFFTNNVINPVVYYATLKDFREGYKTMLCRLCRPSRTAEQTSNATDKIYKISKSATPT